MTTPDVADALGRAILASTDAVDIDPTDPDRHLAIVRSAADAHRVAGELLQQAVSAARAGGHSWAAIGNALGLTRQAAQQRFGKVDEASIDSDVRWLGPVTAMDEMRELALAGRLGWHTAGAGLMRHRMVRTNTQWEHKRVLWTGSLDRYQRQGWQVGCRAFPWIYLIRDTGLPPDD
jgi:hypothetical protein